MGFRSAGEAQAAVKYFDKSFLDTSRLVVEVCCGGAFPSMCIVSSCCALFEALGPAFMPAVVACACRILRNVRAGAAGFVSTVAACCARMPSPSAPHAITPHQHHPPPHTPPPPPPNPAPGQFAFKYGTAQEALRAWSKYTSGTSANKKAAQAGAGASSGANAQPLGAAAGAAEGEGGAKKARDRKKNKGQEPRLEEGGAQGVGASWVKVEGVGGGGGGGQ